MLNDHISPRFYFNRKLINFQENEFEDIKEKLRHYKTASVLKLFKFSSGNAKQQAVNESHLVSSEKSPSKSKKTPNNLTIVEGKYTYFSFNRKNAQDEMFSDELDVIREGDMNVVTFPPTPQKQNLGHPLSSGLSTQILPLSRLSSGNSPPDPSLTTLTNIEPREKEASFEPVRERLQRLTKSLAEPLLQYFHELHVASPDCEEPDVLSTPRSLAARSTNARTGSNGVQRSLFVNGDGKAAEDKVYANMPPITITDM